MHDMPLVIFTVLSQLVVGGFITLWWLDRSKKEISQSTGLIISIVLVVIGGISVIISMFHLGQPFHAYRVLLNIGVSWLSREAVFYGVFVGFCLLYAWFWYKNDSPKRNVVGIITSIIGVVTIFSSGMIYVLPSVPGWNGVTTITTFFLTTILLGPLMVGVILAMRKELNVNFFKITIPSLVVGVFVTIVHLYSLKAGLPEATETLQLMVASVLFWIRAILFIGALGLVAFAFKNKRQSTFVYSFAFALIIVSEFLARIQFYETAVHLTT